MNAVVVGSQPHPSDTINRSILCENFINQVLVALAGGSLGIFSFNNLCITVNLV